MAAFRAAVAADVGIECDLRLSRDGFAMVFHDGNLGRLCGIDVATESLDAAALMALRLGGSDERIPWLGDLLEMVAGRVPLLLELKHARGTIAGLCRAVAATIRRYDGPLGVMSFEPAVGEWFAEHRPTVRRGLILDGSDADWERAWNIRRSACDFVAVKLNRITDRWVAELRRDGLAVLCWTVRSAADRKTAQVHAGGLIWEGDGRP